MLNATIGVFLIPSSLMLRSVGSAQSFLRLSLTVRSIQWSRHLIADYPDYFPVTEDYFYIRRPSVEIVCLNYSFPGHVKDISVGVIQNFIHVIPEAQEFSNDSDCQDS
ncbi:MAG TPA: hypothetical protein DCE14_07560 [Kosmotogaceae bacterium]|nr:MAG: hypothetical protein XE05_0884 [Thermotogales bacterium 46_20]HAA86184.1 hypothetical protein [Kosmotogaceae bacterium]